MFGLAAISIASDAESYKASVARLVACFECLAATRKVAHVHPRTNSINKCAKKLAARVAFPGSPGEPTRGRDGRIPSNVAARGQEVTSTR